MAERTAHLFAAMADNEGDDTGVLRRLDKPARSGVSVPKNSPAVRALPDLPDQAGPKEDPELSLLDDPRRMSRFVDEVVKRIEKRVVDELERRGRRFTPGVF